MNLKLIGWLIFEGGIVVGVLITVFFAYLKINRLRKSMKLKDDKIRLLERQLEIASKMGEEEID